MKSGVIGLGAMGSGMAKNLHESGHLHRIWNRTNATADELSKELGVSISASIQDLASECELIVVCVSRAGQDHQTISEWARSRLVPDEPG